MATSNFEKCLVVTLKWEGGYSNHPDDPGGPTMKGIIQREYDAWRRHHGLSIRPVRKIEENEMQAIYRNEYWDAMACDGLEPGFDLCVFDAAVNSGVGRAKQWLECAGEIDAFCDLRLSFLQRLGRLWRVFGAGWRRRVAGIRSEAHVMSTGEADVIHAGMKGERVKSIQQLLTDHGYPCGNIDGIFGELTYEAVVRFQESHGLRDAAGVWLPSYETAIAAAATPLPLAA